MTQQPRVFVVQQTMRRNGDRLVPVHDVTPASAYGELVLLLGPGNVSLNPAPMMSDLIRKLRDFNDNDFLVPIGDPAAIAAASIVAASFNAGRVKLLKWDRQTERYYSIQLKR